MDDLIREMLEPERPAPGVVARRRRFVATLSIIGLAALGVTSLTTNALFTSESNSDRTGFLSGTILIESGETSWATSAGNAAPGDSYFVEIPVTNGGTLELRYAMELTAEASGPGGGSSTLLDHLEFTMFPQATNCTAAGVVGLTPGNSAVLSSSTDPHKAVGDKSTGPDTGDRVLSVGGSEVLCLRLDFDLDAPDTVQGHEATLNFQFYAEQTANNS